MLGRTIGNYEIVSPFGEGGMGELYLGRHARLVAREVIIKTIRTEDFSPRQVEHLRERLEREAFVQSQLDHPNIVRVYDFIASGDTTCIVMEYVPGRDLRKMITRETGPIPDYRALKLFKQVLAAIDYAHNFIYLDKTGTRHQGIIHRDLKPANILVTPDDLVKVTDFGIVKVRGVKGGTQMGFNPGTPEYMSPEQARGRELDHRSDIYALGVVLYEMLTGRVPFEGDGSGTSDYEIRRGHIEMAVPAMSEFYPGISPELEKVVLKSLEKNPDDRFQTTRQFLELLEEYELTGTAKVTGRMLGARQTLLAEGRGTARQSLADAPTVGIGNTVVTDTSRSSGAAPRSGNNVASLPSANSAGVDIYSRQKAARQSVEQKSKLPLIIGVAVTILLVIGISAWLLTRTPKPPVAPSNGAPPDMTAIPGGKFMMGRDAADASEFEKPAHEVTVAPFFMDTYEVTNEQYAEFVRSRNRSVPEHWLNGAPRSGEDRFPVINVNWTDARDYCEFRDKRLPTEEEWEWAARGRENYLYPYGNEWKPQFSSASPSPEQIGKLSVVGSYPAGASPFGVMDMAGNVAEWTASDYVPYPGSPARPDNGNKIQRGGSFINLPSQQTATERFFNLPGRKFDYVGFRCAKDKQ